MLILLLLVPPVLWIWELYFVQGQVAFCQAHLDGWSLS
jgi:hypothetical protein